MQGFFIAALWLKLCNKKKDKMFEFQLSTLNEKVSNQIFFELKNTIAETNAVLTSYAENGRNNIVVACDEIEKPRVCFFLTDVISDAISTFFKLEFVEDNLKIPVKNEISFKAFKKALVAFDRETDKYIVSRSLKIENELIIAVTNRGYTDNVMSVAREAGARGGTVIHARGTGDEASEKFFGETVGAEREMIFIVVSKEDKKNVMNAIMEKVGINSDAQTFVFTLPVIDVAR